MSPWAVQVPRQAAGPQSPTSNPHTLRTSISVCSLSSSSPQLPPSPFSISSSAGKVVKASWEGEREGGSCCCLTEPECGYGADELPSARRR